MLKEMSYLEAIAWIARNENETDREALEQTGTVGLISIVFGVPVAAVAGEVLRVRSQYPRIEFGDDTISKLGNEVVRLFDVIRKKDEELVERMREIVSLRKDQDAALRRISALEGIVAGKDARIEQINREFTACGRDLGKQVRELQRERTDLELLARNRLHAIEAMKKTETILEMNLKDKAAEIQRLKETEKTLEADLVHADKVNAKLAEKLRDAERKEQER